MTSRQVAAVSALQEYQNQMVSLAGVVNSAALVTAISASAENVDLWPLLKLPAQLFALGVVLALITIGVRLSFLASGREEARLRDDFDAAHAAMTAGAGAPGDTARVVATSRALWAYLNGPLGRTSRWLNLAQKAVALLGGALFLLGLIMGGDNMLSSYGPGKEPAVMRAPGTVDVLYAPQVGSTQADVLATSASSAIGGDPFRSAPLRVGTRERLHAALALSGEAVAHATGD